MPSSPKRSPMDNQKTQRSSASFSKAFDSKALKDPSMMTGTGMNFPLPSNTVTGASADFVHEGSMKASVRALKSPRASQAVAASVSTSKQISSPAYSAKVKQSGTDGNELAIDDGGGHADIPASIGYKLELCFGIASTSLFTALYVFLTINQCVEKIKMIVWIKGFAIAGIVAGLFTVVYSCFERSMTPRQGLMGCLYFTTIVVISCTNLVGAYLSLSCLCKCIGTIKGSDDLLILVLEICGSLCLLAVLLVVSTTNLIHKSRQ